MTRPKTVFKTEGFQPLANKGIPGKAAKQENKTDETISRETAIAIGNDIIARIRECTPVRVSFAGSIRRELERVHDIDILVSPYSPIVHSLLGQDYPHSELLWSGPDRISFVLTRQAPCSDQCNGQPAIQVDVRFVKEESWGPALQYFTGSREHNVSLRQIARAKGLKLNEFGLWDSSNQRVDDGTEGSVYRMLGLRWLPPRYRNNYIGKHKKNSSNLANSMDAKRDGNSDRRPERGHV